MSNIPNSETKPSGASVGDCAAVRQDAFRKIVASIGAGVVLTDRDGSITLANREAERCFDESAEDMVGRPLKSYCMLEEPDEIDQLLAYYRDDDVRESFSDDVFFRGNWYQVRFSRIDDPEGRFSGVLLTVQDIHERKLMEQQMRTATLEMENANMELADTMDRIEEQAGRLNLAFEELRAADERIKDQNQKMIKDLNSAKRIQSALLPQTIPSVDGWAFDFRYVPCEQVGGDVLNVFPLDDRHVAIYQADVSGHGVSAAMVSVFAHQAIKGIELGHGAGDIVPTNEVLRLLNLELIRAEFEDMPFLTIFYGILDTKTRKLRFTAAAHPMPIVIDTQAGTAEQIAYPEASPLGWFPEDDYAVNEIEMKPGQRLVIHTDGVTEIFNPDEEMLSDAQFLDFLVRESENDLPAFGDGVIRMVGDFTGKEVQDDDITVIAVDCVAEVVCVDNDREPVRNETAPLEGHSCPGPAN